MEAAERSRCFRPSPAWLVVALLIATVGLWLSSCLGWPAWHKGYAVLTAMAIGIAVLVFLLIWFALALIIRRRFQFSLRSLMMLVVALSLPCSWLAVEIRQARSHVAVVGVIDNLGGKVTCSSRLSWINHFVGADLFVDSFSIKFASVSDAQLDSIKGLEGPIVLDLSDSGMTDSQLARLCDNDAILGLNLDSNRITDSGIASLETLHGLKVLSLVDTEVSNAGLTHLQVLRQLKLLFLPLGRVTKNAGYELRCTLPECHISLHSTACNLPPLDARGPGPTDVDNP